MKNMQHYRGCNLCEAICGIAIQVDGDRIDAIRGDKDDPLSRGYLCPKAVALQDLHNDPDRLRHPMRRTAAGWTRIGWNEAFDEVAARIKTLQRNHGRDAMAVYLGNPSVHNYGTMLFAPGFLATLRTKNSYSATSLDQLPQMLVAALLYGHQLLLPVPDVDRTDFFVIMGGNPLVSNGSLMTAPDMKRRLHAIQARGGKVIVIDPRRTETARVADQHLFIRPGTDALLLLGILSVLHEENLARPGRLVSFVDGLDEFWQSVKGMSLESIAAATGIEAPEIRDLGRSFARAERAVWYGRVGACTQEFGTLTQWLIAVLNIVTGNLDRPGGCMFTRPAFDLIGMKGLNRGTFGRWRSRVRGLPEFAGQLPTAALAEEMLTPGQGQVRGLVTIAGNPVLSSPNGRKLDQALAGLDFMVAIDFYRNETTRHAHIILPPTGPLEHENYDVIFNLLAVRNQARWSPALFAPAPDTRHDWEIFLELDTRLKSRGLLSGCKARLLRTLQRRLGPKGILDLGLRFGTYGSGWRLWRRRLNVARLEEAVHGLDLGQLESCLPGRLRTATKRIHLVPAVLRADLERLRGTLSREQHGLVLIGRRNLRSNNSWMHNSERLVKGPDRCTLLMHPTDAAACAVSEGQRVRITSRVGSIETTATLSEEMMPGVVSLPHGWGHDRADVQLTTAQCHPGVSINDVTDETSLDALSGNAALSGVRVTVVGIG